MLRPAMTDAPQLARDREPLGLWLHDGAPIAAPPGMRVQQLEFSSRGDRVTGLLYQPASGRGPHPLALVQHALGDSAMGVLGALFAGAVPTGMALAAIDFPLHGARTDQKLLRLLENGDARCSGLAHEFVQQAVIDLQRALDAIDAQPIGYVGVGLGAQIGAAFCALDPRPAAVVLAPGVGGALAAAPDPERHLGRIAPRPVLRVTEQPGAAAAEIWAFLTRNLAPRR
jgi:pimeloyl-ACP methyl ester carboxylesterase